MPVLEKIVVQDFRNIEFQEVAFSSNINCITGLNGEGKTNLLDAIHYLSMTKSAFPVQDRYIWRYGTKGFALGGTYLMENGLRSNFSIKVSEEGKKLVMDEKAVTRFSSHIGKLPVVMVSPGDISLVSESGDERRRFANSVLAQMDAEYLAAIQGYNKVLAQRNKVLKDSPADSALLEVLDMRLEALGRPVFEARKKLCRDMSPVLAKFYALISGGREEVGIAYQSDLEKGSLADMLLAARERDLILRYTGNGVQRDDLLFTMNGQPIRRCGSQGQQKSFLVALKFAQYEIMKNAYGYAPTLLLDDVFDKLDLGRISNLIGMVAGSDFGQIFITDANKVRLGGIVDSITEDRAYFEASGGVFTKAL